jgi:hypothetical protein
MKKFHLKGFLVLGLLAGSMVSQAQLNPPKFNTNYYLDYVGQQLFVSDPVSISGPVIYTTTNDGTTSTNNWGGYFATAVLDKELVFWMYYAISEHGR